MMLTFGVLGRGSCLRHLFCGRIRVRFERGRRAQLHQGFFQMLLRRVARNPARLQAHTRGKPSIDFAHALTQTPGAWSFTKPSVS
jgi:hypothetical protein